MSRALQSTNVRPVEWSAHSKAHISNGSRTISHSLSVSLCVSLCDRFYYYYADYVRNTSIAHLFCRAFGYNHTTHLIVIYSKLKRVRYAAALWTETVKRKAHTQTVSNNENYLIIPVTRCRNASTRASYSHQYCDTVTQNKTEWKKKMRACHFYHVCTIFRVVFIVAVFSLFHSTSIENHLRNGHSYWMFLAYWAQYI